MCEPVTILTAIAVTSAAVGYVDQRNQAKAQVKALDQANEVQADEISKAAGRELSDRARAARRERASQRAIGSEIGVNLDSGSFLSALQTSAFNQYNDQGTIIQNERGQQRARAANARTARAGISVPSYLQGALQIGGAGAGAYFGAKGRQKNASEKAAA